MTRPRLTVVIGANGAGKTTWAREHRDTLPRPFYNADSIAGGLGDANDPGLQRTARELVDQQIERRHRRYARRAPPLAGSIGSGGKQRHVPGGRGGAIQRWFASTGTVSSRKLFAK